MASEYFWGLLSFDCSPLSFPVIHSFLVLAVNKLASGNEPDLRGRLDLSRSLISKYNQPTNQISFPFVHFPQLQGHKPSPSCHHFFPKCKASMQFSWFHSCPPIIYSPHCIKNDLLNKTCKVCNAFMLFSGEGLKSFTWPTMHGLACPTSFFRST